MAAPRLITLDNVSEQLPLWQPADASHLHAVVDMGRSARAGAVPRRAVLCCAVLTRPGQQWHPLLHHVAGAARASPPAARLLGPCRHIALRCPDPVALGPPLPARDH